MGKIGIMGGTFDPIHNGHLHLGKMAYAECGLDRIWYMPSGHPPHKKRREVTDAAHRCNMTRLAIEGYPEFLFSDFEVRREGDTYTAQTLALLAERYPQHEFYFIIGADSLFEIEGWYEPERVMAQAALIVAGRDYENALRTMDGQVRYLTQKYGARILRLHGEEVDISSAKIRHMLSQHKPVVKYVPERVADYIRRNHLYQESGDGKGMDDEAGKDKGDKDRRKRGSEPWMQG